MERLIEIDIRGDKGHRLGKSDIVDHQLAWSFYFCDPDGNRFELTTYDYDDVKNSLGSAPPITP